MRKWIIVLIRCICKHFVVDVYYTFTRQNIITIMILSCLEGMARIPCSFVDVKGTIIS